MAIISSTAVLQDALSHHYAIGGFICYDMEMMQAVAHAAKAENSHVLLQASCRADDYAGARFLRKIAEAASEKYGMDYVLHLDHGDSVERCKHCINEGFTSVMLDNTGLPLEENIRLTQEVVAYAHARGVSVEGEVMHPIEGPLMFDTSVEETVTYAEKTGVDSLSICVGNPHGLSHDFPHHLDLRRIEAIHQALPELPLVLHATGLSDRATVEAFNSVGSMKKISEGFPPEELEEAIRLGVAKINCGAEIKMIITTSIRQYMLSHPTVADPRPYLGAARDRVEMVVRERLCQFHSSGRYFE